LDGEAGGVLDFDLLLLLLLGGNLGDFGGNNLEDFGGDNFNGDNLCLDGDLDGDFLDGDLDGDFLDGDLCICLDGDLCICLGDDFFVGAINNNGDNPLLPFCSR
jgi:hypothetical protein